MFMEATPAVVMPRGQGLQRTLLGWSANFPIGQE
jgi:hypothetical protein